MFDFLKGKHVHIPLSHAGNPDMHLIMKLQSTSVEHIGVNLCFTPPSAATPA